MPSEPVEVRIGKLDRQTMEVAKELLEEAANGIEKELKKQIDFLKEENEFLRQRVAELEAGHK